MPGGSLPSAHYWTGGSRYLSGWMMRCSRPSGLEQLDGKLAWRMRCRANRWNCSTAASREKVTRRLSCIAGSYRCFEWIRFPTSFNSSNWCRRKLALAILVYANHAWNWREMNSSKPERLFVPRGSPGQVCVTRWKVQQGLKRADDQGKPRTFIIGGPVSQVLFCPVSRVRYFSDDWERLKSPLRHDPPQSLGKRFAASDHHTGRQVHGMVQTFDGR